MHSLRHKGVTKKSSEQYHFDKHRDKQDSADKILLIQSRVHTQCTVKLNPKTFERVRGLLAQV
jgi:hypothetical protein